MSKFEETILPYNGTEGYVSGSDTSRERAISTAQSGKATARQQSVLDALHQNPHGLTWKELGALLGLHHGQISATLSVLHGAGKIFAMKHKRQGSHPYLAIDYAGLYPPSAVILTPSKTLNSKKRQAMLKVVEMARLVDEDYTIETASLLRKAITELDAIADT